MPSTRVASKDSIVNRTDVFGSMAGNGKHVGRSALEMRQNTPFPNRDPAIQVTAGKSTKDQIQALKENGFFQLNKMSGGIGRRSVMYNMQLRW